MQMDANTATQIGAGGLFLLFATREVLNYIAKRRSEPAVARNMAGAKDTDYWRLELRTAVSEVIENKVSPVMEQQTEILRHMQEIENRQTEILQEIVAMQRAGRAASSRG